ncbi:MAG: lipopolysaccharide heptosyltransferase family protein [Betaproteobacteria bacterium]|nr:lipopolysaccharide heptosyltransferase family protein [Betaproteobacteria bacterium]
MSSQLVPAELLQKANKILFITHLAIGDYTYLQNCFEAFSHAYPHLRIHLWVDEVRRTNNASQWEGLRKYVLYDWLEATPFFEKIYNKTYSPALFQQSVHEAQQEAYPIIVSLANLRPHLYAKLARTIGPNAFIAGLRPPLKLSTLHHLFSYKKLDAALIPSFSKKSGMHISDIYASHFRQLFGIEIDSGRRFPFVNIPPAWLEKAEDFLTNQGIDRAKDKVVFINAFAKTKKRSWPIERVLELVTAMKKLPEYKNAWFLINSMPSDFAEMTEILKRHEFKQTKPFSASENFFQLPAILHLCSLIISVETAVMHLANAVHVPVIALMRQKNPEWAPLDKDNSIVITTKTRRAWVKEIEIASVKHALDEMTPESHQEPVAP